MKAAFVKKLDGFTGNAGLYRLEPPAKDYSGEHEHEYVVVSATAVVFSGPETYIFPADEEGHVTNWGRTPRFNPWISFT